MSSNPQPIGPIQGDTELKYKWSEYAQHGTWTMNPPDDQGYYARGSRDGQYLDIVQVITHYGEPFFKIGTTLRPVSDWAGYWWSKPLPMLPDPPEVP